MLRSSSPLRRVAGSTTAGNDHAGRILGQSAAMPGVLMTVTEFGNSLELHNGWRETTTVYRRSDEELQPAGN